MRILLLNQFGFASGAPTGRILGELGSALEEHCHDVVFLSSDFEYGISRRGMRRILHELRAHLVLLGLSCGQRKIDAVISLTSPTCLAITAGWIATFHRAKHFHWIMDLYPEVGERLGEVKSRFVTEFLRRLMSWSYRKAARVIAVDEDMQDYLRESYALRSTVISPFPPEVTWPEITEEKKSYGRWLYSGNFGRAHEIEVLLQVQKKLEERGVKAELILQGKGAQFVSSQSEARLLGLKNVEWHPPVSDAGLAGSLLESQVLVVTRKAELKGLLLPSKLILAELSGQVILWIGDTDGKTSQRLKQGGRHGVFGVREVEALAAWLQAVFESDMVARLIKPKDSRESRELSFGQWEELLKM